MHMLSAHNRSEFLATPQLVRFEYAKGLHGREPTLLIKASTLGLKYIILHVRMQLLFARIDDRLLYALKVWDDDKKPGTLWSILEREEEKAALEAMLSGEECQMFLFNELAVNVAWSSLPITLDPALRDMVRTTATGRVDYPRLKDKVSSMLDCVSAGGTADHSFVTVDLPSDANWHPLKNHFITSHASSSLIDLFNKDEGGQQEQLAIWLTDNLHPLGVHHGPLLRKGKGFRELTDVLISYQFGSILVESKTLAVLTRDQLPNRGKLAHDVSAHIDKAVEQLRGGMRRIKDGTPSWTRHSAPSRSNELIRCME